MNDTPASDPIGRYRATKVYAARWHTLANPMLPASMRRQFQVLVLLLGELAWINITPAELVQ